MDEQLIIQLFLLIIGVVIGVFLGIYVQKLKGKTEESIWSERHLQVQQILQQQDAKITQLEAERKASLQEKEHLTVALTRHQATIEALTSKNQEQKEEVEKLEAKFTKEFQNLANKILEENSSKFTEQNQKNIKQILSPLQEKILHFEQKIELSQRENISIHSALKQQLVTLQDQNLKITKEAESLTKALKGDSKTQGNWGELVLERVLEKSGLEKGREYTVQQSFKREDNTRSIPDVIINLTDGKKMIIDSKVSLKAYEQFTNASDDEQEMFLKAHIGSLTNHIKDLSAKKYEDIYAMESPDFVLMFIPVEPAFATAVNFDKGLYEKALEKNIVMVTPTTLLATLKTIETMWKNEKQQQNAVEIARQAGALYDKFEGFINDLVKVGDRINGAKNEYGNAMNKLFEGRGNIINQIEKLKVMGANTKKSLPENILKRANKQ